jgi:type VI secretion system secreted protein Hcp
VGIYWKPEKAAKGDATEKGHTDWIKLDSVGLDSGRHVFSATGRVADRQASTGHVGEIMITKSMDAASMNLFKAACIGAGEKMEIDVTRAGSIDDQSEVVYLKYKLEDAIITSYVFNTSGSAPSESLTINFTTITMTYTPQDPALKGTSGQTVSFNQPEATGKG